MGPHAEGDAYILKPKAINSPLRILHLPKWYPHRYDDQDGDFVARQVAAGAGQPGVQVAVVFAAVARGPLPRLLVAEAEPAGPVPTWRYYYRARITGWGPLDKLLKLGLWLWATHQGLQAVRRHWGGAAPDVVHAHVMFRPALLARWWRAWHGWSYALTEHWTLFQPANAARLGWWRGRLAGWLVRGAAAWLPVSRNLAEALVRLGGTNPQTTIVPNVVDTELFRPPAPAEARTGLLHVAAFNEAAKNLGGLLRTLARLRAERPDLAADLHLRVAGYGPDEARLRAYAAELGLLTSGAVEFVGKLTSAQVAAEMRRAQALVLFSYYENLPCVLIEAQASGLPAVATRVGGVPELLPTPDLGLLVPAGDEAALAEALLAVLTAPAGRFDAAALRARAVAEFGYPAVGRALAAVYARTLGQ